MTPVALQQFMDTMLSGSDMAEQYLDDIVIYGITERENNDNLFKVLNHIQEYELLIQMLSL